MNYNSNWLKKNFVFVSLFSDEPAPQLIRSVARQNWKLIVFNFGSNIIDTMMEGGTLAILFLAVQVLTAKSAAAFNWGSNPLLNWNPTLAEWLNSLNPKIIFICLLSIALILQAIQSVARFFNQVSVGYFSARCRTIVLSRIHEQILSFSFPCASSFKVGDLVDYSFTGPEAIRIHVEQIAALIVNLLLAVTYLWFLVIISPSLVIAVGFIVAIMTLIQKTLLPKLQAGSSNVSHLMSNVGSLISENIQALRLLHSLGQIDHANDNLKQLLGNLEIEMRKQIRRLAIVSPVSSFLPTAAIALMAGFAILFIGSRNTGILPSLVTFVLALQRLNIRLAGIASNQNSLSDNVGRFNRLNYILSSSGKNFRKIGGKHFGEIKSEIAFNSVSLRYESSHCYALADINFKIPKGKTIALVGYSGAGKSSIADLLSGLYCPTSGEILVDGVSLNQIELKTWQRRLGVVSQDTFLFNATIAENISFGLRGVTSDQIRSACLNAQASGFIESLPHGYETIIGERGYRLSGGQRQRLSLARAIIREPELLILDEATSALDSHSERLVQEAIERFEESHTVLVIAHRLSTIVNADQIQFMEAGRIVESGTHLELLEQKGKYEKLWNQQIALSKQSLNLSASST